MTAPKSGRSNDSGAFYVAAAVVAAAVVVYRNQARLAPAVTRAETALTAAGPGLVQALVAAAAAAVAVAAVRAVRAARRRARLELGRRHLAALRAAGLAKATHDTDGTPVVITPTRTVDAAGEHITYVLPEGVSVGQVAATGDRFPAALRLPARATIGAHRDLPYHLRITVPPPPLALTERRPVLAEATRWSDPIVIGRDTRTGADITAPTWNVPAWLVGGRSGSGKSVALRLLIAHYALDPDAVLWGFDAKGSTDDWGSIRPRLAKWVTTTGDTAVDGQLLMDTLRELDAEVFRRNAAPGRDYPGILVLLEEITALRDDMPVKDRAALDGLLGRLVKMCRSANVTLVITAQRPSARDLPTTVRAQAEVLLCMRMTRPSDASMVLGEQPDYDVSAFPDGHGLISVKGDLRPVVVDYFTDDAWRGFCDRWATASAPSAPALPDVEEPPRKVEGVVKACAAIVAASPAGAVTPTDLFELLPAGLRPATVRDLTRILTAHGWATTPKTVRIHGKVCRPYLAADIPVNGAVTEAVTEPGPVEDVTAGQRRLRLVKEGSELPADVGPTASVTSSAARATSVQ